MTSMRRWMTSQAVARGLSATTVVQSKMRKASCAAERRIGARTSPGSRTRPGTSCRSSRRGERRQPMNLDEIRGRNEQTVTFRLLPDAPRAPVVTGRVLGTIEAADGLVVTIEPKGAPGKRVTVHHQHIASATPA